MTDTTVTPTTREFTTVAAPAYLVFANDDRYAGVYYTNKAGDVLPAASAGKKGVKAVEFTSRMAIFVRSTVEGVKGSFIAVPFGTVAPKGVRSLTARFLSLGLLSAGVGMLNAPKDRTRRNISARWLMRENSAARTDNGVTYAAEFGYGIGGLWTVDPALAAHADMPASFVVGLRHLLSVMVGRQIVVNSNNQSMVAPQQDGKDIALLPRAPALRAKAALHLAINHLSTQDAWVGNDDRTRTVLDFGYDVPYLATLVGIADCSVSQKRDGKGTVSHPFQFFPLQALIAKAAGVEESAVVMPKRLPNLRTATNAQSRTGAARLDLSADVEF